MQTSNKLLIDSKKCNQRHIDSIELRTTSTAEHLAQLQYSWVHAVRRLVVK